MWSCDHNITNPPNEPLFSTSITGKVILENQTEFSNTLVYIDSLNRGVSTDSVGNYTLVFNKEDSIYSGVFTVLYFLYDYDIDSAKIVLDKGRVRLDTLDVDSEGKIQTMEMKQIVLIEGWTDQPEYRVGDTVTSTARVTNLSDRIIHIHITSCNGILSNFVFLYNDKYQSFPLGCNSTVLTLDCDIYLSPNEYYEGTIGDEIIECRPLVLDEYIVIAGGFFVEDRLLTPFESKFNRYVAEEWHKIHRGPSPKLDQIPNKFRFPYVRIIE
jgi:hypothetical protein